jgi:tetratricopeptide (TPR) repeat protein
MKRPSPAFVTRFVLGLALAAAGTWNGEVFAQPAQSARDAAAEHFDRGNVYYKLSRFAEAEAEFQKAWDIKRSYDVAANLGDCEIEVGQAREAAEHLAYAIRELPLSAKEGVRKRLSERFEKAKSEVATLRIQVNVARAAITVNGRDVGTSPLEGEVFVEPGSVTVVATLATNETARLAFEAERGATRAVMLTLGPAGAGGDGSAKPAKSTALVASGAVVAVAAAAVGIAFVVLSNGKASDADKAREQLIGGTGTETPCANGQNPGPCRALKGLNEDSDTFSRVAFAGFLGAGIVAAATATYVLWPTKRAERARVRFAPMAGSGFAGVSAGGHF